MLFKLKPFSDAYSKATRSIHGTIGMVFLVLGILVMVAGLVLDDSFDYIMIAVLFMLWGNASFNRRSQFVENEAIYKAIQARRKEEERP